MLKAIVALVLGAHYAAQAFRIDPSSQQITDGEMIVIHFF